MCGIAGFFDPTLSPDTVSTFLKAADSALAHRGPDHNESVLITSDKTITPVRKNQRYRSLGGLIHRRLSIIDRSTDGHQPMTDETGRHVIVQNGEIYNYIELRETLNKLGYRFHTQSDTEVLLYALIEWGMSALEKCIGMYAFCFVDLQEDTILIARDHYGIKPLYYHTTKTGFYFGSEIKSLRPITSTAANSQTVYDYLTLGFSDHTTNTFYKDIQSLSPGHYIKANLSSPSQLKTQQYKKPSPPRLKVQDISFADAVRQTRAQLETSINYHMRSDVDYGALLSGGLDSSCIAMIMHQRNQRKSPIKTFTYTARNSVINEEAYADIVNNTIDAQSHKIQLDSKSIIAKIDPLLHAQDEPFGSTSIFAQYCVFESIKEKNVTVILDGQGADEIFSGYRQYYSAALADYIRKGHLLKASQLVLSLTKSGRMLFTPLLLRSMLRILPSVMIKNVQKHHSKRFLNQYLNKQWFAPFSEKLDLSHLPNFQSSLDKTLSLDFNTTNLPCLLRYADRNSMAHSIESRVPFLSQDLVRFVQSLPTEYLIAPNGQDKYVLREAMKDIVPSEIINRKDKIGFQTPEFDWFATLHPWIKNHLESDIAQSIPFFDLRKITDNHLTSLLSTQIGQRQVWRWVNLIAWVKNNNISFER